MVKTSSPWNRVHLNKEKWQREKLKGYVGVCSLNVELGCQSSLTAVWEVCLVNRDKVHSEDYL